MIFKKIEDYDYEIDNLNQKINKYSEYVKSHPEKIGVKGNIKTLTYVRDELIKERDTIIKKQGTVDKLIVNEDMNLHISGENIKNHSIYAPLFSDIINIFVEMSTFFSAAIKYGVKNMDKHIDAKFRREAGYYIKTSPGSFKITFSPTVHSDNQSTWVPSLNKQFFDKLCGLINDGDNISILDQVNLLGLNSIINYKKFIGLLDSNKLDISIDDGDESNPLVMLDYDNAHQINKVFKNFNKNDTETERIIIKGLVYSINIDSKKFGIKYYDKESDKDIKIHSIKFREGLKLEVMRNVDSEVEVVLEKTTTRNFSSDEVKEVYDLVEIND